MLSWEKAGEGKNYTRTFLQDAHQDFHSISMFMTLPQCSLPCHP